MTQPLDGALTNADREWLNYPMHMWNVGADVVLRDHHSVNANLRGWNTMKIVAPFNAPNPGGYGELSGRMVSSTPATWPGMCSRASISGCR